MATKDSWTATSASTEIVPANKYREVVCIQKTNATTVALGLGEAAVGGEGVQLTATGTSATIRGAKARSAIYAIGNGGTGTYQEGDVEVHEGPTVVSP